MSLLLKLIQIIQIQIKHLNYTTKQKQKQN